MVEQEHPHPPRAIGPSSPFWDDLDPETREMISAIADAARRRQAVRIYYRDKVTTQPGGSDAGRPSRVYRTIFPYSLRTRMVHIHGYDKPPVPTIVFFGWDPYAIEGPTIKMFVSSRILSVEYMGKVYTPKWAIEFSSLLNRVVNDLVERCDEST